MEFPGKPNVIQIMTKAEEQEDRLSEQMTGPLFNRRGRAHFCIGNKQMLPSAGKTCIILSGYSVEEAYCGLAFDFARV